MIFDDTDEYTLYIHSQNKKNRTRVKSDHRPIILKIKLESTKIKPQRNEPFFSRQKFTAIIYRNKRKHK